MAPHLRLVLFKRRTKGKSDSFSSFHVMTFYDMTSPSSSGSVMCLIAFSYRLFSQFSSFLVGLEFIFVATPLYQLSFYY